MGLAMGFPLAPLLADIFLIELERSLIPNLGKIKFWGRYVDDSICSCRRISGNTKLIVIHAQPLKYICKRKFNICFLKYKI